MEGLKIGFSDCGTDWLKLINIELTMTESRIYLSYLSKSDAIKKEVINISTLSFYVEGTCVSNTEYSENCIVTHNSVLPLFSLYPHFLGDFIYLWL